MKRLCTSSKNVRSQMFEIIAQVKSERINCNRERSAEFLVVDCSILHRLKTVKKCKT